MAKKSKGGSAAPPETRFGGAAGLLLLSIAFHLAYLGSIFDIYFKSPVTRGVGVRYGVDAPAAAPSAGMQPRREGLAKRVVLIVGELSRWLELVQRGERQRRA